MKIKIIFVGKTDEVALENLTNLYFNKLKHYVAVELIVLNDKKFKAFLPDQQKKEQANLIFAVLQNTDFVVLLDEAGQTFSSVEFANNLAKKQLANIQNLVLIIGGAFGFDASIYERANEKWSLSKMTFSHQMVRLFLLEQLYRAFSILKGEKYHHS